MGRSSVTILGIAMLAGAAIYVGRTYLDPAAEESQRNKSVLTGAMDPQLIEAAVLQDSDLPDGVPPLRVGEDAMYLLVSVLYPGVPQVPEPKEHRLTLVNGHPAAVQTPAHVETEVDEDGARVNLLYRVAPDFESGAIERGKTTVVKTFILE